MAEVSASPWTGQPQTFLMGDSRLPCPCVLLLVRGSWDVSPQRVCPAQVISLRSPIILFTWKAKTEVFDLLLHSQDAHSSQSWPGHCIWVSYAGGPDPPSHALPPSGLYLSKKLDLQVELGLEYRASDDLGVVDSPEPCLPYAECPVHLTVSVSIFNMG